MSFSISFHLVLLYLSLLNWRLETWKMRVLLNPTVVVLLQYNCTWRKKRAFLLHTQAWTSSDFSECEYLLPNHDSSDAPYWLHVCLVCSVCVCVRECMRESECMCAYVFVFTGFKCSFLSRDVVEWNLKKKQKKIGQEPMALHLCSNWPRRKNSKNFGKMGAKSKAREKK